jgi:hypothetical protein
VAGRARVCGNPWAAIVFPFVALVAAGGVGVLIEAPDTWGVFAGLFICVSLVPLLWLLSTCVLIVTDSGLWWFGRHLPWRDIRGFVVREYESSDSWWPFNVGSVVTDRRSVDLYATARWKRSRVESLVARLEAERRRSAG